MVSGVDFNGLLESSIGFHKIVDATKKKTYIFVTMTTSRTYFRGPEDSQTAQYASVMASRGMYPFSYVRGYRRESILR
jgi:hypothetical protein